MSRVVQIPACTAGGVHIRAVRQWTGLPISIGIAETKTLAKIANRLAKTSAKTDGVLDLTGERWRDRALVSTEVGDIWGIGRQYAKKLNRNGVMTALDLAYRPDGWVRKELGVGGLKTVRELRGEDCIGLDHMPQPTSRRRWSRGPSVRKCVTTTRWPMRSPHVRDRCGEVHSQGQPCRLLGKRVHRDQPFRQKPAPCAIASGAAVARDQQHETCRAIRADRPEAHLPRGAGVQARRGDAARPRRSRASANLVIRYAGSKGRQADQSIRRHQRPVGAGIDPVRPSGAGHGLAVEQCVPLAQLHNTLGRHPEG